MIATMILLPHIDGYRRWSFWQRPTVHSSFGISHKTRIRATESAVNATHDSSFSVHGLSHVQKPSLWRHNQLQLPVSVHDQEMALLGQICSRRSDITHILAKSNGLEK